MPRASLRAMFVTLVPTELSFRAAGAVTGGVKSMEGPGLICNENSVWEPKEPAVPDYPNCQHWHVTNDLGKGFSQHCFLPMSAEEPRTAVE